MKTNITTSIVVTLVLSKEEAEWLHFAMQNPLMEDESPEDREMRQKFWEATQNT